MRVSVIGVGSNLLVRDGGIPGVVVRLPAAFGKVAVEGTRDHAPAPRRSTPMWRASPPTPASRVWNSCAAFPGTIGGALRMNAGCYGREIKDIFVEATRH